MRSPPNKGKGRGIALIREHMHDEDGPCLIWPLTRDWQGYGLFGYNGKQYRASRFMCEQVNGPPPADKPNALHSCGNGHTGCYHPKHLYWGTLSENQADSKAHGTSGRGLGVGRQKLSDAQVEEMRALAATGVMQYVLAQRYGIRRETVGQILRGNFRKGKNPKLNRLLDATTRAEIVARAKRMRADGMTYAQVAAQIDVSIPTARRLALS